MDNDILLYTVLRTDDNGNQRYKDITNEQTKIINNVVILNELPYEFERVQVIPPSGDITEMVEIDIRQPIINANQYKVNYNDPNAIVYFHPDRDGQTMTFQYTGMGLMYIDASRVVTLYENGTIKETLNQLIEQINTTLQDSLDLEQTIKDNETTRQTTFTNNENTRQQTFDTNETARETQFGQMQTDYQNATHTNIITWAEWTFTATSDNTTEYDLNVPQYNPLIDDVRLLYEGMELDRDVNYTLVGTHITLGWALNNGEQIVHRIIKGVNYAPQPADASLYPNNSIPKEKLALDAYNTLQSVGNKDNLLTNNKTSLVNAINENTSQLADITTNKLPLKANQSDLGNKANLPTTDKTSFEKAIIEIFNSLISKLSKSDIQSMIGFADINKNLSKIDQTMLTDALLQQIAGTTPINAVPADYSLTFVKFALPLLLGIKSKNLFNKDTRKDGYYVASNSGVEIALAGYAVSDFIPINASTAYILSGTGEQLAFYNSSKVYISGIATPNYVTFSSPANAAYVKISMRTTQVDTVQLEVGTTSTAYESFYPKFDTNTIKTYIPASKLDPTTVFSVIGKNLFDKNTVTKNYYVQYSDGVIRSLTGYNASDFIPIEAATAYILSGTGEQLAFYNSSKVYISGISNPNYTTFTTPSNAAYVRLTVKDAQLNNTQLEKGKVATTYQPHFIIDSAMVPSNDKPIIVKTVKKDGTGDYTTVADACNSIITSDPKQWYEIQLYDAVYDEKSINVPAYTILRSKFVLGRSWIRGYMSKDSTDAVITPTSTVNIAYDCELHDLKITCQNMRYAVHSEASGANKNATHKMYNCEFTHYGNAEVLQYRTDNNLLSTTNYNALWSGTNPWGYGSASGLTETFEQCTFTGIRCGWYIHNREYFANPTVNILKNCVITGQQYGILIENMGSGTEDLVILEGCQINGKIQTNDTPWISTSATYQYANHADVRIIGHGNNSVPYISTMRGTCLKITSNSTVDSKIAVSGTASDILFGNVVSFNGKNGINGYVYGSLDISGILVGLNADTTVANNLGRRLGDCNTTNKTLIVTVDSNSPITITFNQNYTSMTNTDILSFINTQLGSSAIATEFNISKEYVPEFTDESKTLLNSSANGIKKGSPVCYNTDYTNIRLMLDTDDASLFAGITMEDINPNTYGKVQTKGYIYIDRLIRETGTTFTFGSKYGVSSNGKIVQSNTNSIGKCMYANYLYINVQ